MIADPVVGLYPVGVPELIVDLCADNGVQVIGVGRAIPPQQPRSSRSLKRRVELDWARMTGSDAAQAAADRG